MSIDAPGSDARQQVFATYLVFRHADRAHDRGKLPAIALDAIAEAARTRVAAIWQTVAPGMGAVAYAWILDRVKLLLAEGVITDRMAQRIRTVAAERAQGATAPRQMGALGMLWRLHILYLLVIELEEKGELPGNAKQRIKEAIHMLALTTFNSEARRSAGHARPLVDTVLELARAQVRELVSAKTIAETDGKVLLAQLGDVGAVRTGGPAIDTGAGSCLVCGDGFASAAVVYCASCDTPHHTDCWNYLKKCAMFACGCLEAAPRPGARPDPGIRFDVEQPAPVRRAVPPPQTESFNIPQFFALLMFGLGVLILLLG